MKWKYTCLQGSAPSPSALSKRCEGVEIRASGNEKYLEHFAFLVVVESFVLDAYNHFVFEHGSVFLGKQLTRCLPLRLLIPEFLIREPEKVRMENGKQEVEYDLRVFD